MAYLLDSHILIYFFKNLGAVRSHVTKYKDTDIHLCTPVLWEFLTGAYKSQHPQSQLRKLAAVRRRFQTELLDPAVRTTRPVREPFSKKLASPSVRRTC